MPLFYFDIHEDSRSSRDTHGFVFPDAAAAEREATKAAAAIGRDVFSDDSARQVIIEVLNHHRDRVVTVALTMRIERGLSGTS